MSKLLVICFKVHLVKGKKAYMSRVGDSRSCSRSCIRNHNRNRIRSRSTSTMGDSSTSCSTSSMVDSSLKYQFIFRHLLLLSIEYYYSIYIPHEPHELHEPHEPHPHPHDIFDLVFRRLFYFCKFVCFFLFLIVLMLSRSKLNCLL